MDVDPDLRPSSQQIFEALQVCHCVNDQRVTRSSTVVDVSLNALLSESLMPPWIPSVLHLQL